MRSRQALADPDARPIGKGMLRKRYELGYAFQFAGLTVNTRRGARGLILPAAGRIGSPNERELLPSAVAEPERLGLRPCEVALDGGFPVEAANRAFPDAEFHRGRQHPPSHRSKERLASYRAGRRAASAISSAAAACADPGCAAATAHRPGPVGRSSATTSTRSPSIAVERLRERPGSPRRQPTRTKRRGSPRPLHIDDPPRPIRPPRAHEPPGEYPGFFPGK